MKNLFQGLIVLILFTSCFDSERVYTENDNQAYEEAAKFILLKLQDEFQNHPECLDELISSKLNNSEAFKCLVKNQSMDKPELYDPHNNEPMIQKNGNNIKLYFNNKEELFVEFDLK